MPTTPQLTTSTNMKLCCYCLVKECSPQGFASHERACAKQIAEQQATKKAQEQKVNSKAMNIKGKLIEITV